MKLVVKPEWVRMPELDERGCRGCMYIPQENACPGLGHDGCNGTSILIENNKKAIEKYLIARTRNRLGVDDDRTQS